MHCNLMLPTVNEPIVGYIQLESDSPAVNACAADVKELNVLRDLTPRLLPRLIAPVMYQFVLQRAPNRSIRALS